MHIDENTDDNVDMNSSYLLSVSARKIMKMPHLRHTNDNADMNSSYLLSARKMM